MASGTWVIQGDRRGILVAAGHVEEAFAQMDVAVADAGGGNAHQYFRALRLGIGLLDALQRLAELHDLVTFHCSLPVSDAVQDKGKPAELRAPCGLLCYEAANKKSVPEEAMMKRLFAALAAATPLSTA